MIRRRLLAAVALLSVLVAPLALAASTAYQPQSLSADPLHRIADHITAVPADQHSGPYTYLRVQSWRRERKTIKGVEVIARVEVEHWQHVNGSVHMTTRRPPALTDPNRTPDGTDRPDFATATVETDDFAAGQAGPVIAPESVSTDPATLTAQLHGLRGSTGTDALLFAITEINYKAYLGRGQRVAVLRVLARLDGVLHDGETTDLAGRSGITFRYADSAATTWLTINPTTGELLSYRRAFNDSDPPTFNHYWLLLDRDRRDRVTGGRPS